MSLCPICFAILCPSLVIGHHGSMAMICIELDALWQSTQAMAAVHIPPLFLICFIRPTIWRTFSMSITNTSSRSAVIGTAGALSRLLAQPFYIQYKSSAVSFHIGVPVQQISEKHLPFANNASFLVLVKCRT